MTALYIHYENRLACTIQEDKDGIYTLEYSPQWIKDKESFALSLALPIRKEIYRGKVVTSFFENLLPEGEQRRQIERLAGIANNDDFAFLERFGEDCAGALSVSKYPDPNHASREDSKVKEIPVSYSAIEKAIGEGRPIQYALDIDGELPPFSLAGAQAKFPCVLVGEKIYLPQSGTATTHIIKLPIRAGEKLLDSVENEYLSMTLARRSGLHVPDVRIMGEKIALFCIERFDRKATAAGVKRLHTQDLCQALGRTSKEKYERHGGPKFADCYETIRDNSNTIPHDVLALLDWMGFNLAIGNNDSHAKNLSLIHQNRSLALSPFYDLISTALYTQYNPNFAFKIGEVSSWDKINYKQIEIFAKNLGITVALVTKRWLEIFDRIETGLLDIEQEVAAQASLKKTSGKIARETRKRIKTLRMNCVKPKSLKV